MKLIIIKKRLFHKIGNYFYRLAQLYWRIAIVCNYCGKDVGFKSVVSKFGFTCWDCKFRLESEDIKR